MFSKQLIPSLKLRNMKNWNSILLKAHAYFMAWPIGDAEIISEKENIMDI